MRIFDILMWIMFIISSIVSIITILVLFGISYGAFLKPFSTMLPLEISLALTFFLWGLNSIYGSYLIDKDNNPKFSIMLFALGGILLIFVIFGIY